MTAIHETAYPRVRSNLTEQELRDLYTPTADDAAFVARTTHSPVAVFGCMMLVKTFQRLGYFTAFDALPPRLIAHIATALAMQEPHDTLQQYERRRLRGWHLPLIRDYLGITAFSAGGRRVLIGALLEAARSKDMLADLINVGIETLVHARYELPAFSTLHRAAQHARTQVNLSYYHQAYAALDDGQRMMLTRLLTRGEDEAGSLWQRLKREPKQPTTKRLREYTAHVRWLQSMNTVRAAVESLPEAKLQRFADEARALDVARMKETPEPKRYTLAVALLRVRTAQAVDDVAEMFIRRVQKLHQRGKEALEEYRRHHQEQTDALVRLLGQIVSGWQNSPTPEERLTTIDTVIGDQAETIRERCEIHLEYAGDNYVPFLPRLFRSQRQVCLEVLALLRPTATSTDTALEQAIAFILLHRQARAARLSVIEEGPDPTRS